MTPADTLPQTASAQASLIGAVSARLLMCPPTAYALQYEINPWMSLKNRPDLMMAQRQWHGLHRTLTEEVGAEAVPARSQRGRVPLGGHIEVESTIEEERIARACRAPAEGTA